MFPSAVDRSITGVRECHGSSRNSEPSEPTTSSSSRGGMSKPQSKWARAPLANRIVATNRTSTAASRLWAVTCSGSPSRKRAPDTQ